jgi:hypothetical protein
LDHTQDNLRTKDEEAANNRIGECSGRFLDLLSIPPSGYILEARKDDKEDDYRYRKDQENLEQSEKEFSDGIELEWVGNRDDTSTTSWCSRIEPSSNITGTRNWVVRRIATRLTCGSRS